MEHPIESFQSRSFRFSCAVVGLYMKLARKPDFPLHLARQVLRSGTSVGANLEEAKAAQTRRDMAAKFSIALKEARETAYWLRLFQATGLAEPPLLEPLIEQANSLIGLLTTARRKLNRPIGG